MYSKNLLITGGAGFIGSNLVDYFLQKGWNVKVIDNCSSGNKIPAKILQKISFLEGDVRDYHDTHQAIRDVDVVIHLAAVVGVDEVINRASETIETETIGTHNVIRAALHHGVRHILYASSSAVYSKIYHGASQEEDPLSLVNTYAVAKRLNEDYLQAIAEESKIRTNALRFFNIYGDRQDERMVIPRFFQQAITGAPISIFGTGQQTRDFTQVNDVVQSIDALIHSPSINGIFNICRGKETTIFDLAKMIVKITNSDSVIQTLPFPTDRLSYKVDRRIGSNQKLFKHTSTKPRIDLEEGLIQYYQNWHKNQAKPNTLKR